MFPVPRGRHQVPGRDDCGQPSLRPSPLPGGGRAGHQGGDHPGRRHPLADSAPLHMVSRLSSISNIYHQLQQNFPPNSTNSPSLYKLSQVDDVLEGQGGAGAGVPQL